MTTPSLDQSQLAREEFLRRQVECARMLRDEAARRVGMCRAEHLLAQIVERREVFAEAGAEI